MSKLKNTLAVFLLLLSSSALAFMPATGIWGVDSEDNGLPGRGFQIEAENEVIVFTYFGYRPDGSSVFYYASGPIVNNTFTATLLDLHSGTTFGGLYKTAILGEPAGAVTLTFTNGLHGTIILPGEPPKAVSKRPFGYSNGPDGLLGTWLLTTYIGTSPVTDQRVVNVNTGSNTTYGNGVVSSATANFACEYLTSGDYAGNVFCAELPGVTFSDVFLFEFSGDKGSGVSAWKLSNGSFSTLQNAYMNRIKTKNGKQTGLNNGTTDYIAIQSAFPDKLESTQIKEQFSSESSLIADDVNKIEAIKAWAAEVQQLLQP